MTLVRRKNRVSESTLWAAVAAAVVVHATVVGAVHAFGLSVADKNIGRDPAAIAAEAPALKLTCAGDVVLIAGARAALCLAPWSGDLEGCGYDAQMAMWMDLSSCQARNDPGTAVSLVEQKQTEKLQPIDAEKLIEEMKQQQEQKKPPPPVPVPQQKPEQVAQRPPPPPAPPRPAQVIETVKPSDEAEPENARFLAEYNTKVEKEKVARGARNEPLVAKSKPEELTPRDKPKDDRSRNAEAARQLLGELEYSATDYFGNEGSDKLIGGAGFDFFDGGSGADKIDARDGSLDLIVFDPLDGIEADPFDIFV